MPQGPLYERRLSPGQAFSLLMCGALGVLCACQSTPPNLSHVQEVDTQTLRVYIDDPEGVNEAITRVRQSNPWVAYVWLSAEAVSDEECVALDMLDDRMGEAGYFQSGVTRPMLFETIGTGFMTKYFRDVVSPMQVSEGTFERLAGALWEAGLDFDWEHDTGGLSLWIRPDQAGEAVRIATSIDVRVAIEDGF